MERRLKGFIWIGLGISLLLALFLSPFASSSPDGLEKVAETKGFAEKAKGLSFWKYAPLPDYAIPWIKNERVSTALSGLIGTLAIFFLAMGVGKLIRKGPNQKMIVFIAFPLMIFSTLILSSSFVDAARPLTTDDAWTVEKGKFQLEFGFDGARQDNHDWEFGPSLMLSYGLLERMDIGLGSGYLFLDPREGDKENGFADTELKAKYRLFDENKWIPAFAISGILKIPTASESKGLGSGKTDFGMNAIATKKVGERWVVHLNLGYAFIGGGDAANEMNYSLAGQFILTEKWALVGEVVGINNFNGRHGDDPLSSLIGTYYSILENLIIDAGVEIGLNKAAPDFRITTGLTWLFKP
jgi:cobalt/nickel transport protein